MRVHLRTTEVLLDFSEKPYGAISFAIKQRRDSRIWNRFSMAY